MAAVEQVRDPADPRVAVYRTARDPKLVRDQGLFIAESREVVRRLLESSRFAARSVFVTPTAFAALEPLLSREDGPPVFVAERRVLEKVTGFETHRGCIAIGERGEGLPLEPFWEQRLLVGLEAVTDPDNIGSIFRTASAFGVGGILLSPRTVEPLYRKAIRTSMGATLELPFTRVNPWLDGLAVARQRGFRIIAVTPGAATVDIAEVADAGERPTILLLGSEGDGLSHETRAFADARVEIPMPNPAHSIDSINVGVAAGIATYLYTRKKP